MDCYDHSQFHVLISGVALHDVVLVFGAYAQFIFSLKQTAWNWVFRAIWASLFEMLAMLNISMQIYNCIYLTENKETHKRPPLKGGDFGFFQSSELQFVNLATFSGLFGLSPLPQQINPIILLTLTTAKTIMLPKWKAKPL